MTPEDRRFEIQASRYEFPYHYLATLDESGAISIHRALHWGLDYLTYMSFVADLITDRLKAQSVLDVGCGDGRLLNMLKGKVPRLAGVDVMERAILFARAFNPALTFFVGDVMTVPGQFEVITLIEVMEHIPDSAYPGFIDEVARKTSPGGKLIISVPTINVPLNRKHYRHYDLPLLEKQLTPAFQVEEHWFTSKQGGIFSLMNYLLQNHIGIVLPGIWRRMVWRLHRRYTYMANASDGGHLIALAAFKG